MNEEKCQRCGKETQDLRILWMSCPADMKNLGVPFKEEHQFHFYTIRACKECRARWMDAIKKWWRSSLGNDQIYDTGYEDGHQDGFNEGYDKGHKDLYMEREQYYERGVKEGIQQVVDTIESFFGEE